MELISYAIHLLASQIAISKHHPRQMARILPHRIRLCFSLNQSRCYRPTGRGKNNHHSEMAFRASVASRTAHQDITVGGKAFMESMMHSCIRIDVQCAQEEVHELSDSFQGMEINCLSV